MRYYLGIDGGGTKTESLLVDGSGHLSGHGVGPGCNPNRCTDESLRTAVAESIGRAARTRPPGTVIAAVYAGVAGASHPRNGARLQAAIAAAVPPGALVRVASDTVPALWSGTRGQPGIVLVAGTGATAYGEDGCGGKHRAGGWGYLIGDDGSGYALGREAVRAVCRWCDGSAESTVLWDRLAATYGLSEPLDLVPLVYGAERPLFDQLVPLVLEAYREGDRSAREAVERVVADQAALIAAVHRSLDLSGSRFTVVLRGGLLKAGDALRPLLEDALARSLPGVAFRIDGEDAPPVFGSVLLALSLEAQNTDEAAERLLEDMRGAGLCPQGPSSQK